MNIILKLLLISQLYQICQLNQLYKFDNLYNPDHVQKNILRPDRQIILSAGLGIYSQISLLGQYEVFKNYSKLKLITTISILTYYIDFNGMLAVYNQNETVNAEEFQYFIKNETGLNALPCIFCDSTLGACGGSDLYLRLQNLYNNKQSFINDTIRRAKKYGWIGYSVDIEEINTINISTYNKLTEFMIEWHYLLKKEGLTLSIWIGDAGMYNFTKLFHTSLQLITMSTYDSYYDDFITNAKWLIIGKNTSDVGFGFLTKAASGREALSGNEFYKIIDWLMNTTCNTISIWSSFVDEEWFVAMNHYLNN